MFRKGRFTVYFQGNNLATVIFRPGDTYLIDIHEKFFEGAGLKESTDFSTWGSYVRVETDAKGAHRLLQRRNIGRLARAIRKVNVGEEITFEQILIADNPPSAGFLIIDRQVQDLHQPKRLDLLGLRRIGSGAYGFIVIEVKLGKNGDLTDKVAGQLEGYVTHIKGEARAYKECYEKTYEQKKVLGAFLFLLARLDRDRKVLAIIEVPARDRVRDLRRSPERKEQVQATNSFEIVGPRLPALVVVGFGSVLEISHVLDRHAAAVKGCTRCASDIGTPVAAIARRNRRPPKSYGNHGQQRSPKPS